MTRYDVVTFNNVKKLIGDVAVLGPEYTFSSIAAKKYDPKAKIWHANSIADVFDLVKSGKVKKGIVPIENNLTGTVFETSNGLFESNLQIQEEFNLPVHHFLVGMCKVDLKKIKTIYSHIQPLRQCRKYLKKHFPKASTIALSSTSAAIKKMIADDCKDAAVICSQEAAKAFKMSILSKNIEDYKLNETRFVIIGKKGLAVRSAGNYKTSVAFYFSADAPGTLYQVLGEFSTADVNMTKIQSQANPEVPGGNVFYVDFEGSIEKASVKKMLSRIRKLVKKVKIFGCYRLKG